MRVLFVHAKGLDQLGGAELSLQGHIAGAPLGTQVQVIRPDQECDLRPFDAVVLANLRPEGGLGEDAELAWAELWLQRLKNYAGFVLRSERDLHPCGHRDGRCITGLVPRKIPCDCSPRIPQAFARLYNRCDVVQFLSPAHQAVINQIIFIRTRQVVIAPPVNLEHFRPEIPWERRPRSALICGDAIRVAPTAAARARRHGFEPEFVPYLSVPYEQMPALYNRYQAFVVDPVVFHAFARVVVEALACGCQVLASERVGAMSWLDPLQACRQANQHFWALFPANSANLGKKGA